MSDVLLTSIVEETSSERGFTVRSFKLTGEPAAAAIVNAVAGGFIRREPEISIEEMLRARIGQKVTLVYTGENMGGAGLITARPGTLFPGSSGGVSMLPKGKRKNGFRIDAGRVLEVLDGYDVEGARGLVEAERTRYPQLRNLTQERLAELPANSGTCTLAVFGTYPLPDCTATDALWLIGEYDAENDICDRNVLLLRPEDGFSEHGSIYGQQLLSLPVGEVVGFQPVSFDDAVRLCDLDYEEAVARALGQAVAA